MYAVAQRGHLFDSLRGWLGAEAESLSALRPESCDAVNQMFARVSHVVTPEDFGIDPESPRAGLALVMGILLERIKEAARLIGEFGFDVVDIGLVSESWRIQPNTPGYGPRRTTDKLRRDIAAAQRPLGARRP